MDQLKMRYQNSIFAHNTEKYNTKFRMYKFGKIYVLLTNDRHVYHGFALSSNYSTRRFAYYSTLSIQKNKKYIIIKPAKSSSAMRDTFESILLKKLLSHIITIKIII